MENTTADRTVANEGALEIATEKLLDFMEEKGKKSFSGPFPRENYRAGFAEYVKIAVTSYLHEDFSNYRAWRAGEMECLRKADLEIAQLKKDLEFAQKPFSVVMAFQLEGGGYQRYDCEVTDIGHSDRILMITCPELENAIKNLP